MNRERSDSWCEQGILVFVLSIILFGPLATGAVLPIQFLVIQGMTVGVAVSWLARLWLRQEPEIFCPPACWGLAVFIVYAVIRYHQADIEYVARQELIRIAVYTVLFWAVVNNLQRIEQAQSVTLTLMLLATTLSFFAVYQAATHYEKIWHFTKPAGYLTRGSGTFVNPNHLAGFLEMVLPVGLAAALMSRMGYSKRILLGYSALVSAVGIGVTGSRGGWIAAGSALGFYLCVSLFRGRHRWGALAMLGLLGTAGAWFFVRFGTPSLRLDASFNNGQWIDARRYIWETALLMWRDHFWLGVGPGEFDYLFPAYRAPSVPLQMDPLYVHNDYLNTLADWGLAGALIIAATLVLLFAGAAKTWKETSRSRPDKASNKLALVLGIVCGLLAILIHSFADFNMQVPANAIVAVVLIALLSAHFRGKSEHYRLRVKLFGKLLASFAILIAIYWLSWQGWRKAGELAWLDRARQAKHGQDLTAARSALEKAFAVEPKNFKTAYDIGEILRAQSFVGNSDYETLALSAIGWFQRAMTLNPHDAYIPVRIGMCLDWIGKTEEARPYFRRADELDPNDYYMRMLQGWHCMQTRDYLAAKDWFNRSLQLKWAKDNTAAASYLEMANKKLAERAVSNESLENR